MKTPIFILALAAISLHAQQGVYGPGVSHTTVNPAGLSCGAGTQPVQYDPSGLLFTCQNGVLALASSSGGPPTGAAGGDLSGTYPNPGVAALKSVPFCTGYTPTNGQSVVLTTASSPNPCYTAVANLPLAGGTMTGQIVTDGLGNDILVPAGGSITFTADGVHPFSENYFGNTTLPTLPSNTAQHVGPAAATFTSYRIQDPAGIPANGDFLYCAVTTTTCVLTDSGVPASSVLYRAAAKLTGSAQAANIGSQTLVAVPATNTLYQICWYAAETQAATSSSTMPSVTITWNDATDNVSRTYNLSGYNSSTGNATWVVGSQCNLFNAKASTNVQIVGTGYASSGATSMQYTYTAYAITLP